MISFVIQNVLFYTLKFFNLRRVGRFPQITKRILGRRKAKKESTRRKTLVGSGPRLCVQPKHWWGRNGKEDSEGKTMGQGRGRGKGKKEME